MIDEANFLVKMNTLWSEMRKEKKQQFKYKNVRSIEHSDQLQHISAYRVFMFDGCVGILRTAADAIPEHGHTINNKLYLHSLSLESIL